MHQMHRNQLAAAPEQLLQQDLVFTAHVIFIILFFASNSPCVFLKSSQLLGFGQTGVKSEHLLAILVETVVLITMSACRTRWLGLIWCRLRSREITLNCAFLFSVQRLPSLAILDMVPLKPVKFYRIPVGTWKIAAEDFLG